MKMDQQAEKKKDRKSNRTRQKNKTGDSKVESNGSPEIPDRGETSYIPSLPSVEGTNSLPVFLRGGDPCPSRLLLKQALVPQPQKLTGSDVSARAVRLLHLVLA